MKRNTVDIISLGCSKNLVDSEKLMRQLKNYGYRVTHDSDNPQGEIAVINTCGFIGDAKEESVNMILEFCQAKEEGFYEMFLLDLFTGLRRGELIGLRWEDLDFTTGELRVQRQIHPANGECVPKTKASVRTIVLPASIMTILRE